MDHDCFGVVAYTVMCVYKTFDHPSLLLWQRKYEIRSFFLLEGVGRNLRFAQ